MQYRYIMECYYMKVNYMNLKSKATCNYDQIGTGDAFVQVCFTVLPIIYPGRKRLIGQ